MPSRTGQRVGPRTRIAEFMLREAIDGPSDEEWTAPEGDDTEADVEKGRSRGAPSSRHGVLHDSEGRTQRDVLKEPTPGTSAYQRAPRAARKSARKPPSAIPMPTATPPVNPAMTPTVA
jgi:hypothetical protein